MPVNDYKESKTGNSFLDYFVFKAVQTHYDKILSKSDSFRDLCFNALMKNIDKKFMTDFSALAINLIDTNSYYLRNGDKVFTPPAVVLHAGNSLEFLSKIKYPDDYDPLPYLRKNAVMLDFGVRAWVAFDGLVDGEENTGFLVAHASDDSVYIDAYGLFGGVFESPEKLGRKYKMPIENMRAQAKADFSLGSMLTNACIFLGHAAKFEDSSPEARNKIASKKRKKNIGHVKKFSLFKRATLDLQKTGYKPSGDKTGYKLDHLINVRGHFRLQPHGPGRQHRKLIWIEPFEKGVGREKPIFRQYHAANN